MNICPECGSNLLKYHHWAIIEGKWEDCGTWHKWDNIELGTYTCECGKVFTIDQWNYTEFEDKNKPEK